MSENLPIGMVRIGSPGAEKLSAKQSMRDHENYVRGLERYKEMFWELTARYEWVQRNPQKFLEVMQSAEHSDAADDVIDLLVAEELEEIEMAAYDRMWGAADHG